MNSHKRDEYKRKIAEQEQENAELRAHVERLNKSILGFCTAFQNYSEHDGYDIEDSATLFSVANDEVIEALKLVRSTPAQSLQQIKRDAVLEAVEAIKPSAPRGLFQPDDVPAEYNGFCEAVYAMQEHANNLVKDGE